jgi:hypothetical protein
MSQPPVRRESLFPSGSIGRVQGVHIQRVDSHESLSAHPLLSPTSPRNNEIPKYVPYTPRYRPQSTLPSATASQTQGDAGASKSPLTSLKAAAQELGMETGSLGWAILEQLVTSDGEGEWGDIWNALAIGQVHAV